MQTQRQVAAIGWGCESSYKLLYHAHPPSPFIIIIIIIITQSESWYSFYCWRLSRLGHCSRPNVVHSAARAQAEDHLNSIHTGNSVEVASCFDIVAGVDRALENTRYITFFPLPSKFCLCCRIYYSLTSKLLTCYILTTVILFELSCSTTIQ